MCIRDSIIVCPYQHLVEQWVEDIELFNLTPIIGYSASKQKNWKKRLEDDIFDFSIGVIDCLCFVTTNATYSSKFVSKQMTNLGKDTLLLVDEAHNFGSTTLRNKLYPFIEYRLAPVSYTHLNTVWLIWNWKITFINCI